MFNKIHYGFPQEEPDFIILEAGNLKVLYHKGVLRRLILGEVELVRMVHPTVRDKNWGTVPAKILEEKINQEEGSFSVSYKALYRLNEIGLEAICTINGKGDNTLTFEFSGKALENFFKNRVGLCVLLPLEECTGKTCHVEQTSGNYLEQCFPEHISPHQPVKNISSLCWNSSDNIRVGIEFQGDVFEMEDHRNWTDASFKIYCTPLELPFPREMKTGETVQQKVTISVSAESGYNPTESGEKEIQISTIKNPERIKFPAIGVMSSTEITELNGSEAGLIQLAGFDHYRSDLKLFKEGWETEFKIRCRESNKLEVPLELGLHFSMKWKEELNRFNIASENLKPHIARIFIIMENHLYDNILGEDVLPEIRKYYAGIPIGTGTNAYFAELNRNRPPADKFDFTSFSICPQIHAFDNLSMIENLAAQIDTVNSTRHLFPEATPVISAVSLRQRFNFVATDDSLPADIGGFPYNVDPRQPSLFCAAWTLGSIKALAEAGAGSINYYETAGKKGVIFGDSSELIYPGYLGKPGDIYPVYHLFRLINQYKPAYIIPLKSTNPIKAEALLLEKEEQHLLIIANFNSHPIDVMIPDLGEEISCRFVDEHSFGILRSDPMGLDKIPERNVSGNRIQILPAGLAICTF